MFDILYSGNPVVMQTREYFLQLETVADTRTRIEFSKEILWLQESESKLLFKHGGKVLYEGQTHTDFFGYLTSFDSDAMTPIEICRQFGVSQESSLEVVIQTSILLTPVMETPETIDANASQPGGFKTQYAAVPSNWCQEVSGGVRPIYPALSRKTLCAEIVWSSKNTPQQNDHLLLAFKEKWRIPSKEQEGKS